MMRVTLSDNNATVLSNVAHEGRDTSLKTLKISLYTTHICSHYFAILKDKTVRCLRVLQNVPTPRTAGGRLRRNNTVSCCEAAKCREPDFPKASLPFSAQNSAR